MVIFSNIWSNSYKLITIERNLKSSIKLKVIEIKMALLEQKVKSNKWRKKKSLNSLSQVVIAHKAFIYE